jgi:hypothetical protein
MNLASLWKAVFTPRPRPVNRILKGPLERVSQYYRNDIVFGYTYLLKNSAQPVRLAARTDAFRFRGYPELTQPGDEVTMEVTAAHEVVAFCNHTLAARLQAADVEE